MTTNSPLPRVGYILRSYPRLSQTFVLNEILALEQLGVPIHIFAITHPHETVVQEQVAAIRGPVAYLEADEQRPWWATLAEHLHTLAAAPRRYVQTLWYVLRHREFDEGYTAASRFTCFRLAVFLVNLLRHQAAQGQPITHLHAHFAHDPTLVAQLAHRLTGISYSFTAHARDLYQIPAQAVAERVRAARAVVTCCAVNLEYLQATTPPADHAKLRVIHNGVNLSEFQPVTSIPSAAPPLILSASRLVEKKGYPDLIHAYQQLKTRQQPFRAVIYGEGPLQPEIEQLIHQLDLADQVAMGGACTQQQLRGLLQQADIFALTPFVTDDGDRDGVPTVLVEAMACGLPVVSTTVAGVPELVTHEQNGLLAAPRDVATVADQLAGLLQDQERRAQLGRAARTTVAEQFDLHASACELATLFTQIAQRGIV